MNLSFFNPKIQRSLTLHSSHPIFWNITLDKGRLKNFVFWFLKSYGEKKTLQLLEDLKSLGFGYATKAGISLGIEDLKIPPVKVLMLAEAESAISDSISVYRKGEITGIEKVQRFIETWHETSENLKQEVVKYFEKTDVLNPVYMMAFSGARGNLSQVRQLVGMRGLMSDPQGKIIDFPIQSNFREGLTLTEYLISTYGARKGIVDTALRTATAGYLTRRLVDVAQHVLVAKFDCGTQRGIFLFDMKEGNKTIYSFENRLTGRILSQDLYSDTEQKHKIANRNQEIDSDLARAISKIRKKALVRSPLTCENRKLVCQLCYGWSLATSKLVSIGEAVGVIAGQSIGEPGTQLTMRTFHTGGVFSGGITEQINAPFSGRVEYGEPIAGSCIRTSQGFMAFLTKTFGTVFLKQVDSEFSEKVHEKTEANLIKVYKIPPFTILFARQGEWLEKGRLLAQISALPMGQKTTQIIEQTIYSSLEGEVFYSEIDLLEDIEEKYGERISKSEDWGKVWVLAAQVLNDAVTSNYFPMRGDFVSQNSLLNQVEWFVSFLQPNYLKKSLPISKKILNFVDFPDLKKDFRSKISFSSPETNLENRLKIKQIKEFEIPHQEKNISSSSKSERLSDLHAKIFSKPSIREIFNLQKREDLDVSEKKTIFHTKNANVLIPDLKLANKCFTYPYSFDFHFHLIKVFTQTFVSIPLLQHGTLVRWIQKRKRKCDQKNLSNGRVFELLKDKKKNKNSFIRKINIQKNWRFKNIEPLNFGHPLVLNNILPFFVTYNKSRTKKVLKNFLSRTKIFSDHLLKDSIYSPYFTNGLKNFLLQKFSIENFYKLNPKFTDFWFSKKFKESFSRKFFPNYKAKKDVSSKASLIKLFYHSFQNQNKVAKLDKFEKKGLRRKLDHFVLKNGLLSYNISDIKHNKLGYFISIANQTEHKDRFMSLLPIMGESFIPSSQRNRVINSEIQINKQQKKAGFFPIDVLALKNTDFWAPTSREGFYWFPTFPSTLTNGLISFSSPFFGQKKVLKSYVNSRLKNLKTVSASKKKWMAFTNLSQSQTKKESSFERSSSNELLNQTAISRLNLIDNKTLFSSFNIFLKKNSKNLLLTKRFCWSFSRKKTSPFDWTETKKLEGCYLTLKTEKYRKNQNLVLKSFGFFSKNPNILGKFENKSHFLKRKFEHSYIHNKISPKLGKLKKSFFRNHDQNTENSKNFFEMKNRLLSKKSRNFFETLKMVINSTQKSSVYFNEISWLPHEHYFVKKFVDKFDFTNHSLEIQNRISPIKSRFFFPKISTSNPSLDLEKPALDLYVTNFQGLKKKLRFKEEGLLTIQNCRTLAKQIVEQKVANEKSIKKSIELRNEWLKNRFCSVNTDFVLKFDPTKNDQVLFPKNQKTSLMPFLNHRNQLDSFLKKSFSNYLRSKMTKNRLDLLKTHKKQKFAANSLLSFLNNSMTSKSFFSFVPVFRKRNYDQKKNLENHLNKKRSKLEKVDIFQKLRPETWMLNLKPGWIYKTHKISNFLKLTKLVTPGTFIFDDVSFEQRRTFVEKILNLRLIKSNRIQLTNFIEKIQPGVNDFNSSKNVKSLRPRFWNPVYNELDFVSTKVEKSFYFLIRPFFHQYLPNLQKLKTQLYKSMEKTGLNLIKTSYYLHREYFFKDLNLQILRTKIFDDFLPNDINVNWVNPFFSKTENSLKNGSNRINFQKFSKNFSKKTLFQINSLDWFFLPFKQEILPFEQENSQKLFKQTIEDRFSHDQKKSQKEIVKDRNCQEIFYFSYRSLNCLCLKISLSLNNPRRINQSFSEISLNTSRTNIFFSDKKKNRDFDLVRSQYMQLLMFRSFHKKNKNETSNCKWFENSALEPKDLIIDSPILRNLESSLVSDQSLISFIPPQNVSYKKKKILSSASFLDFFEPLPFFEYSLNQRYAFFANQKLFSSSFYEHQAKKFFRISVFKDQIFRDNSINDQRFTKQVFEQNMFSDSYRNRMISTNKMVFKRAFRNQRVIGSTSFYSPFEGEVLKIYLESEDIKNLEKNVNIYLEKSLLAERRLLKLILTQADIFSLYFDPFKNLSKQSRVEFKREKSLISRSKFQKPCATNWKKDFFTEISITNRLNNIKVYHQHFQNLEINYFNSLNLNKYQISRFNTIYQNKLYKLKAINFGLTHPNRKFRLGELINPGEKFYSEKTFLKAGLILHLNRTKLTLRKAEFFSISPQAILHTYNGHCILKNEAVMTLPFQTLKTGDIVQGIPKVEQYLEARTTVNGRLFLNSLPVLLDAIYKRYANRFDLEKSVRQSFLKIQQILVDGVQRVYRSQGVSIADKHLEVIVRQMTSKVKITYGGQTGFFPGELVDLEFVERMNRFLMVKIQYEPIVLGITRASLEVDSFLSAASFQQTTKVLSRSALENKRDFLKGLKENLLVGNLLPAGTGYILPI